MNRKYDSPIMLRQISIRNYKGVDRLDMEFPEPLLPGDPDVLVMGSRNGLGKSSIIECCALLLLGPILKEESIFHNPNYRSINIPDLLIRAGAKFTEISGKLASGGDTTTVKIKLDLNGKINITGEKEFSRILQNKGINLKKSPNQLIKAICGFTPNPVTESTFMLFHSHRKVQEGNPEMGLMMDNSTARHRTSFMRRYQPPISTFKVQILRSLMGQADLFELDTDKPSGETIDVLNKLMTVYAGGTISKLRSLPDNSIDFRVSPIDGGDSYTFDGLSSGQKEIISTLFLIWYHTSKSPSVVFIDEPELHLNVEWHRRFIHSLIELAPKNQYIIATHSEDVMDTVSKDRRFLLVSDQGAPE